MLYVGVDAHKSTSQITVMNEAGVILQRKRVESTSKGFKEALTGYDEPFKAVLEASYSWGPMYDWLDDVSEEVLLAHPLKVRAIASARIKNDRIDSEVLAHLLRANLIPTAHAPSREIRALRRVLRQRMFFVQLRTMLRNRVRALLAQHSVKVPEGLYTRKGRAWLDHLALPGSDAHLLKADCELHDSIEVQIASTDTLINKLAAEDPAVKWLISLPGIGRFLSVLIRWEEDDIHRVLSARLRKLLNRARGYAEPVRVRSLAGFTRMKSLSHLMWLPVAVGRPPGKVWSSISRSTISSVFMRSQFGRRQLLLSAIWYPSNCTDPLRIP
jgi:transposase